MKSGQTNGLICSTAISILSSGDMEGSQRKINIPPPFQPSFDAITQQGGPRRKLAFTDGQELGEERAGSIFTVQRVLET